MALKPHVVERQMNLVALLMKSRFGLSWRDVRDMDGYAEGEIEKSRQKRFERDIHSLSTIGLIIKITKRIDKPAMYEVDRAACLLPRLNLTPEQRMMAFQFGMAYMDGGAGPLAEPLSQALMKLQAGGGRTGLPDWLPKAFVKRSLHRKPSEGTRLDLIGRALLDKKRVRFDYKNLQGELNKRRVEPWSLVARSGGWYLIGRDAKRKASRVFRISRIQGVVKLDKPLLPGGEYEIPETFDPEEEFSSNSCGGNRGLCENVTVRFDKQFAFIVANEFEGVYELTERKNGNIELHLPKVWPAELLKLLGEFPGHWKILKPKALAEHIQKQLEAALKRHKKGA